METLTCVVTVLFLGIPLWAGAFVTWYVLRVRIPRLNRAATEIATALGLARSRRQKQVWWWEGDVEGHPVGVVPCVLREWDWSVHAERRQSFQRPALRLGVGVLCPDPLRAVAYRAHGESSAPVSFEAAFGRTHAERIPEEGRAALVEFIRRHPGALRLRDRHDAPESLLPPGVLSAAPVVVIHEMAVPDEPAVEGPRRRLRDLVALARAVEAGCDGSPRTEAAP